MRTFAIVACLVLVLASSVYAQQTVQTPGAAARRQRPELDPDLMEEQSKLPLLVSPAPGISNEFGLFLNRNMIVESGQPKPQNESSIAVSPIDPKFLISSAVDYRGSENYIYMSNDGGLSWTNKDLGAVHPGWRSGNDPSVAFDVLGNAFKMYGAFAGVNDRNGVYVSKSTDKGQTWARYTVIEHLDTLTRDSSFEDKYYIIIDNTPTSPYFGRMYTPWKRVIDRDSSTQIVVAHSTDGGPTWVPPVRVSPRKSGTSYDTTFGQSFPLTVVGTGGEVYTFWHDGPIRSIGFSRSDDGGGTFTTPTYPVQNYPTLGTPRKSGTDVYHVLKGVFRAECYPAAAVDLSNSARRGTLYMAYAAGRNPNIYLMKSTDKGNTWSAARTIHSDTTGDQWWPWVMVDPTNGDLAVMCSDSRDDTANIRVNQYVAYSSDGGNTWIDRRATDSSSDYRVNPFVDNIFAGDYSGGAFYAGKIYPSALDTRTNNNDVFTEIMSVMQPYPVENLRVQGNANDLLKAQLTWKNPDQQLTVFGKPYTNYSLVITRDKALIAALPAGSTSYIDSGLVLDKQYTYTVRVALTADTSQPRSVKFKAGEARLPLSPAIVSASQWKPQIDLSVRIPTLRADSVTPLGNLAGYVLYRNGQQLRTGTLQLTDTGSVVTITDTPSERGYYKYTVAIVDGSTPVNQSRLSDSATLYSGDYSLYSQNFDGLAPRFITPAAWGITTALAVSAPNAFTDSPTGDYGIRKNDYMQLYPVSGASIYVQFSHIAIVEPADTAVVDVSYDSARTWRRIGNYNWNSGNGWADKKADAGDWRLEEIMLPGSGPAVVRFGLKTGLFTNADGWYLDDIRFSTTSGVGEQSTVTGNTIASQAYPVPARGLVYVTYALPAVCNVRLEVYDALGNTVAVLQDGKQEAGRHSVTFHPATYNQGDGVYFYRLTTDTGAGARGKLLLMH